MALADDLGHLRDRVTRDLKDAHDYYTDTKRAWRTILRSITAGRTFTVHNRITGTSRTEAELAVKAREYIAGPLAEATFQQFLAIFEHFFLDLLRLWLLAYPRSLMGKKVDFRVVLEAPDKEAIARAVIDKELNELLYERPAHWFAYLEDKAKLGCPTEDEIARFAEAKASRDVLIHNRGIVNHLYLSKAGPLARHKEGERIEISEAYHRETWELLGKVAAEVTTAAIGKAS